MTIIYCPHTTCIHNQIGDKKVCYLLQLASNDDGFKTKDFKCLNFKEGVKLER